MTKCNPEKSKDLYESDEAWDNRELGADEEFVQVAESDPETESAIKEILSDPSFS
jgi:hypothetical protein